MAIKEGRTIFNNIRKFVTYQLSCNVAELSILFFGVLLAHIFGWEIPILLAIHVLFMNLVTSDIPAVSLSLNKSSRDIMEELPRRKTSILTKSYATYFIISGIIMAIFTLLVYYISFNILGHETAYARTNALVVLIVIEIFAAFSFRSFRKGVFGRSIFVNNYLVYASLISIIATVLIIYTPLNKIMETVPIGYEGWATSIVLCILFVAIFDAFKKINNNKKLLDFD
jgi:Ca2+-transporting ATPase